MAADHFAALADYELRHLVTHLAVVARERSGGPAQGMWGPERAVESLLALLRGPDFALAKAARCGPEETVNDYLTAHDIVRHRYADEARQLSRGLAVATVTDSAGKDTVLSPNTLHALLAYRADATMYQALLEFGADPEMVARVVPEPGDRSAVLCAFRHSAATWHRRRGGRENLDLARQLLATAMGDHRAAHASGRLEPRRGEQLLSSIRYDQAYLDYLVGRWEAARVGFRDSATAAHRAGDSTAHYISLILEQMVELYAGVVDPGRFRALLEEASAHFMLAVRSSWHAQRWVMNAHTHSFDLACLIGDVSRAGTELQILETDPWLLAFRPANIRTFRARYSLARQEWTRACASYEEVLAGERDGPGPQPDREGAARDLLDYGVALAGADRPADAQHAWKRGLACPDHAANWPWKDRIRQHLSATGPA